MCGICGIASSNEEPVPPALVTAMRATIAHRGPDDEGLYSGPAVGLGFCRLSIIDLTPTGHQPMANDDRSLWITFNGEIYNFQALRRELEQRGHRFRSRSDTEIILRGYQADGPKFIARLVGMFAIALWDERRRQLFLARDRFGKKPLYYTIHGGRLYYASELQAILAAVPKLDVDEVALAHYFRCQFIPQPRTIYRGVFQLPPGHFAVWENGRLTIERYWQLALTKQEITLEEAGQEFERRFRTAVAERLISDVPLGVFLSGGLDSSIITALVAESSSEPVKTFSIGFAEQSHNELPLARLVAEKYRTDHHEFVIRPQVQDVLPKLMRHYGQPFGDSSAVAVYYVAKETRRHVTVALSGDGGDENFAGYDKYQLLARLAAWDFLPPAVRQGLSTLAQPFLSLLPAAARRKLSVAGQLFADNFIERYLDALFVFSRPALGRLLTFSPTETTEDLAAARLADLPPAASLIDRLTALDLRLYLPDGLMSKTDIATMAWSLEARSPFLDHRVVEFTASLPDKYKIAGGQQKFLLRHRFGHLLPPELLTAAKHGFDLPVNQWLRADLWPYLQERLTDRSFRALPWFHHGYIDQLMRDHRSGQANHGIRLWSLLCFAVWHEEIDR